MHRFSCLLPLFAALAVAVSAPDAVRAQHTHAEHEGHAATGWSFGAHGVLLGTHVTPGLAASNRTEAYLTQPALMAHGAGWDGRLRFDGMLNLEGATLRRGELTPGIWGEGYVDRRHPHTYLHEAVVTVQEARGRLAGSVSVGKGFAPFGTDDPMFRPLVKYPVNHHLAQVLERAIAMGAVRYGPAMLEVGAFNGDEPENTTDAPNLDRFGDSWAARLTVNPVQPLEVQVSRATLDSPEAPKGSGYDHEKWSASARWSRSRGSGSEYALVEWAATQMFDDGIRTQRLTTWLAEAAVQRGRFGLAARLESTQRLEEERLLDPYRSPYPHTDVHALGITRWNTATVAASTITRFGALSAEPFVEVGLSRPNDEITPALFEARSFYGTDAIWTASLGVRMRAGMRHDRMGRYGVAVGGTE